MPILVTGGTGFIGSHTVVELLQSGYEVVVVDNLYNSTRDVLDGIEKITGKRPVFIEGDICDASFMKGVFDSHDIQAVIHFAALKSVGESCDNPFEYYSNNIDGTVKILEIMNTCGVKKLIFSSSATVYDAAKGVAPFGENAPTGGTTNPYGTTKFVMEQIIRDMCAWKDMDACALRYFNPVGGHTSGHIGEDPRKAAPNLYPVILDVLEGKREYLAIFGNDYDTQDGTCIRDYIHVMDVAQAHVAALDGLLCGKIDGFMPINIGTGIGTSVLEMIAIVEKVTGKKVEYRMQPRRNGDVPVSTAGVEKAKEILGRSSAYDLETAVKDGCRFIGMI